MGRARTSLPPLRGIDRVLLGSVVALIGIGILFIYSSTAFNPQFAIPLHGRQLLWAMVGMIGLGGIIMLPPAFFYNTAYVVYGGAIVLLVGVLLTGGGTGASRWFDLGAGIRLQPSEPAKVALVLALARFLSGRDVTFGRIRDLLIPLLLAGVPFLLVARQPDLGTAIIFPAIVLPMLFWRGVPLWGIFLLCSPVLSVITAFSPWTWGIAMIVVAGVLWRVRIHRGVIVLVAIINIGLGVATPMAWEHLHEYQQRRIITFLDPQQDPLGAGYHVIQSTVAVGSGGLTGKGLLAGTQTKLNFLPEQHTDFIFSVIAEETGLLGVIIVLSLFSLVLLRSLRAAGEVRSSFAGLVIVGAASVLFGHMSINLAMALGLLPITGLPLPFITYGGSHLVSQLALVGLILGLRLRWMEY